MMRRGGNSIRTGPAPSNRGFLFFPSVPWRKRLRFFVQFRLEHTAKLFGHLLEGMVPAKVVPKEPGSGVIPVVVFPTVPETVPRTTDFPDKRLLTDAACCFFHDCHGMGKSEG